MPKRTQVTNLDIHSTTHGIRVEVIVERDTSNFTLPIAPDPKDMPEDIRVALMRWLIDGLPKDQKDRWPDIGLPGSA